MLQAGHQVDRYEIVGQLGAGAFGAVYRARHLDLGREDAIKVPHNSDLARRFVTEGRFVAQLDHPNVVRVHAMNMQHDPPFIVYEFVQGKSLRKRMEEVGGPMDSDEVMEIARQVLEGLAAAHELGIIHRDLKPENILLRGDGVAKIADFGLGVAVEQMSMMVSRSMSFGGAVAIARQLGVSREAGNEVESSVAGTLAYMSPEQEDGLELDGRSDLFSLGVVMYEAITGFRPRGRWKDPADVNSDVDASINDAIITALESEREQRHADAGAMMEALSHSDEASSSAAPAPRWHIEFPTVVPPPTPAPSVSHEEQKDEEQPGERFREALGPAGIPLVWVPGGSFRMGSTDGANDERPVHRVDMSGFWISKTEITVAQWRSVVGSLPRVGEQQGEDHPVVWVSWNDARGFCARLDLQLPTEAQWEYAARGPEYRRYPWGDEWEPDRLCWLDNQGPGGRTFPAAHFAEGASWCGALDMAGNVWEWCADWYGDAYYAVSFSADPQGPSNGKRRVLRGGSCYRIGNQCRSAARWHDMPDAKFHSYGFRVVMDRHDA